MGHVALFVALAVVPVLALNSLRHRRPAAPTRRPGRDRCPDAAPASPSRVSALPTPGSQSERPALTQEERRDLRESAKACGLRGPRRALRRLTDEQRQCLADLGVTPPTRPTEGTRPQVSAEQRDALCGRGAGVRPARTWPPRRGGVRRQDLSVSPEPGCGSPTSNHQRDSCSISVTAARSSSLSDAGWRADEDHRERPVVPELVDGTGVEPLPDLGSGAAQVGDDRPGVGEGVGGLDPQHRLRHVRAGEVVDRLLLARSATWTRHAVPSTASGSLPSMVSVHAFTMRDTLRP